MFIYSAPESPRPESPRMFPRVWMTTLCDLGLAPKLLAASLVLRSRWRQRAARTATRGKCLASAETRVRSRDQWRLTFSQLSLDTNINSNSGKITQNIGETLPKCDPFPNIHKLRARASQGDG